MQGQCLFLSEPGFLDPSSIPTSLDLSIQNPNLPTGLLAGAPGEHESMQPFSVGGIF